MAMSLLKSKLHDISKIFKNQNASYLIHLSNSVRIFKIFIYNPLVSLTTKILIVRILRIIWTLTIIWVKIPIQNCLSCDFRERVWISSTLISYIIFLALQIHYNCYFYINRTQGMVLYEMQRLLWEKSKA